MVTRNMQQWYDKYAPVRLDRVAIHKRKLEDIRCGLEDIISGQSENRILLLTGPAGCSKSTVIKNLSSEIVPKYRKCQDSCFRKNGDSVFCIEYDSGANESSPMASFGEFLGQAKYRTGSNLAVILIEDLPNIFHEETKVNFNRSLLEWLCVDAKLPPLVICVTECEIPQQSQGSNIENMFVAESILSREILNHSYLLRIKVNAVNVTIMTGALQYITAREKHNIPNSKQKLVSQFIKELAHRSGDIRSCISMLQFWCSSKIDNNLLSTREVSVNYFHAIGKVIYGSKEDTDEQTINSLLNGKYLINDNFCLGLLENYCQFNNARFSMSTAVNIVNALSEYDLLQTIDPGMENYSEFCLRKIRNEFRQLGRRNGQHGMAVFPREWKVRAMQSRFKLELENFNTVEFYKYHMLPTFKNAVLYFSFYAPFIRNNRYFIKRTLEHFSENHIEKERLQKMKKIHSDCMYVDSGIDFFKRIGGDIQFVSADHELSSIRLIDYMNLDSRRNKSIEKLRKNELADEALSGLDTIEGNNDELDDPIEDSSVDDFTLDDDSLYEVLSQQPYRPSLHFNTRKKLPNLHDDLLSDSDIENF